MKINTFIILTLMSLSPQAKDLSSKSEPTKNNHLAKQQKNLALNTGNKGFGPQSPRDIDEIKGKNTVRFGNAPHYSEMNLCNIHFHKNAEHKGGEFTTPAVAGKGNHGGYKYTGTLTENELTPFNKTVCPDSSGNGIQPGDTIEVHYVHSTANVKPGPSLASCLSETIKNPQLLVESQVFVITTDKTALDFKQLMELGKKNGYHQALNIPDNTGTPVRYQGSTTGPGYNEKGSPFLVSWSVRPKVSKVNIETVSEWCQQNIFDESHAHGVRNLVTNPELLSSP